MPVLDPLLAQLPAQLDELTIPIRRKIDEALERTLQLDAHGVEVEDRLEQLLLGALHRVPGLLLALMVLAVRAGSLRRVLGHAQLLLEVGAQRGQLRDLGHDRPHARQLAVCLLDRVRAEPLHGSTILRSMDATAMRSRLEEARVARLATADAKGRPHVVPITFAVDLDTLYFAVDAKPKRSTDLKRLRNIAANPAVSVLVDHYEDDWERLWWVRVDGTARVLSGGPDVDRAIDLLVRKYDQYRTARPQGPVTAISIERISGWSPRSE